MMTDEVTSTLEPGRELDALVSEQAMRRPVLPLRNGAGPVFGYVEEQTGAVVPYYSTDHFAMWLLVEQLRRDGSTVRLTFTRDGYVCQIDRDGERFVVTEPIEPKCCRMPLAVCRAAMLIVDAQSARDAVEVAS